MAPCFSEPTRFHKTFSASFWNDLQHRGGHNLLQSVILADLALVNTSETIQLQIKRHEASTERQKNPWRAGSSAPGFKRDLILHLWPERGLYSFYPVVCSTNMCRINEQLMHGETTKIDSLCLFIGRWRNQSSTINIFEQPHYRGLLNIINVTHCYSVGLEAAATHLFWILLKPR